MRTLFIERCESAECWKWAALLENSQLHSIGQYKIYSFISFLLAQNDETICTVRFSTDYSNFICYTVICVCFWCNRSMRNKIQDILCLKCSHSFSVGWVFLIGIDCARWSPYLDDIPNRMCLCLFVLCVSMFIAYSTISMSIICWQ